MLALASVTLALLPVTAFAGVTTLVSVHSDGTQGDGGSESPAISSDGHVVAFESVATNLVDGDDNGVQDVFVHDRDTGTTTRVSVHSDGSQGDGICSYPAISADGRVVAFPSRAANLVGGDENGDWDVFVHDLDTGTTARVSVHSDGSQGDGRSFGRPAISADGRVVAFYSAATNLVDGDDNGRGDIFVHDRDAEPPVLPGDLDGDGDVDSDDVAVIVAARGEPATGPDDPRDLDGDGVITALDARLLVLQCTRPYCATE